MGRRHKDETVFFGNKLVILKESKMKKVVRIHGREGVWCNTECMAAAEERPSSPQELLEIVRRYMYVPPWRSLVYSLTATRTQFRGWYAPPVAFWKDNVDNGNHRYTRGFFGVDVFHVEF